MSRFILECENIKKSYNTNNENNFTLDIEELKIEKGKIYALLGPNGSGKTTFIKLILNLISLDSGNIKLLNTSHTDKYSRDGIAYLPENYVFPENFTFNEILYYYGNLRTGDKSKLKEEISYLAQNFDIEFLQDKLNSFSKGMKQIVGLLYSFIGDPELLILDEPFNGLDAVQKSKMIDYIKEKKINDEITVLITTHILSDIDKIADEVSLIKNGELISNKNIKTIESECTNVESFYLKHFSE